MISVSHLSCETDGRLLLDDLSFKISEGEYAAVIGLNGAGKTTLLRCLDLLLDQWTGEILVNDRSIRSYSRRELAQLEALVGQMPEIPPFTVRQYITLARYPHLNTFAALDQNDFDAVDSALAKTGIKDLADRPLNTLSGGEFRKTNLAAAIVQQTGILLLDEISAFLDYRHQAEISLLLTELNRTEKKTILEVTHDLNRAVLQADHLIALSKGKIVFDGCPRDLMTPPNLRMIYGTELITVAHPQNKMPMIVPAAGMSSDF